jgi:hypothetical protein
LALHCWLPGLQHAGKQHLLSAPLGVRAVGEEAHAQQTLQILLEPHHLAATGLDGRTALKAALAGPRLPAAKTAGPTGRLAAEPGERAAETDGYHQVRPACAPRPQHLNQ